MLCCALAPWGLFAQNNALRQQVEQAYGLDQHLINGTLFYQTQNRTAGHPYLGRDEFIPGKVQVGPHWHATRLKYDIHRQDLVIEYLDLNGAPMQLRPVMDHIPSFYLGSLEFCRRQAEDQELFYQKVDFWGQSCLVQWSKSLNPVSNQSAILEQFGEARPSCFLEVQGRLEGFSGKGSFSKLFPPSRQKQVRKFLTRRQFSFRRTSAQALADTLHALEKHLDEQQP